jgi:HAMP domain-containing protein
MKILALPKGETMRTRKLNQRSFLFATCQTFVVILALAIAMPAFGQAYGQGGGGMGGMGMGMDMGMGGMSAPLSPLEKLKQRLQKSKSDTTRKQILTQIGGLLSSQYDSYLQENEAELQQMEARVKNLRTQLERRKDAKSQLLKLEIQRISNEASGLVWPDEPDPMSGMGMGGMGGMAGGPGMGMGEMGGEASYYGDVPEVPMIPIAKPDDEAIAKAKNQLRQITLAALNFESANMYLPKNITDKDGKRLLSWRVSILQYMDEPEQQLYKRFKLDEPWDGAHNIQLLNEMPDVFKNAEFDSSMKTVYLGFEGEKTLFEPGKKISFGMITDGTSNTVLAAQMNRQSAIEWTKPADIPFEIGTKVTQLAETNDGRIRTSLCDGSVREVLIENLDDNLDNLIQRDDGKFANLK